MMNTDDNADDDGRLREEGKNSSLIYSEAKPIYMLYYRMQ